MERQGLTIRFVFVFVFAFVSLFALSHATVIVFAICDATPPMAPSQIFVRCLNGRTRCFQFQKTSLPCEDLKMFLSVTEAIPASCMRLVSGTKELVCGSSLVAGSDGFFPSCTLLLRLRGGKGGFGSLLRGAANKAGQKKTSNFDACRDMSGRRLRHVNAEKKLKEWKAEAKERELEKVAEEFLKKERKNKDEDTGVMKEMEKFREETVKSMEEVELAVLRGLKESKRLGVDGKRKKVEAVKTAAKRACIWMAKGEEEFDEDEDKGCEELNDEDEDKGCEKLNASVDLTRLLRMKSIVECNPNLEGASTSSSSPQESPVVIEAHDMSENIELQKEMKPIDDVLENGSLKDGLEQIICVSNYTSSPPQESPVVIEAHDMSENIALQKETKSIDDVLENGIIKDGLEQTICVRNYMNVATIERKTDESLCIDALECQKEANEEDPLKPLNFDDFSTVKDLEVLGLEKLKSELQVRGLKCGGSLSERSSRLFLLKSTSLERLDKKYFCKVKH